MKYSLKLLSVVPLVISATVLAAPQEYQLSVKGNLSTTEVRLASDETGKTTINHNGKTIHNPKYSVVLEQQGSKTFNVLGYGDENHFNLDVRTQGCSEAKVIKLTAQQFTLCDTLFTLSNIDDSELMQF